MKRVITADEANSQAIDLRAMELPDVAGEARQALAEASALARRIVEEARAEAQDIYREASRRGHEEGLARGRQEGAAEARQAARQEAGDRIGTELAELTACARKVVGELAAAREQLLQEARDEMLDFAIQLARKIVARVAQSDPQAAQANLRKALELAGAGASVTVLVNPSQLAMLQAHAAELVESLRLGGQVELRGDERVDRGGARLLSRQGEIDATIRTQLDNVVEALCGEPPAESRDDDSRGGVPTPPRMADDAVKDDKRV